MSTSSDADLLRYAPVYATGQVVEALERARELQKEGVLRRGVYYLVLVDLVEPIDLIQALDLHPVD